MCWTCRNPLGVPGFEFAVRLELSSSDFGVHAGVPNSCDEDQDNRQTRSGRMAKHLFFHDIWHRLCELGGLVRRLPDKLAFRRLEFEAMIALLDRLATRTAAARARAKAQTNSGQQVARDAP